MSSLLNLDDCEFLKGTFTQKYMYPDFIIKREGHQRKYNTTNYIRCHHINVLNHESSINNIFGKLQTLFDGKDFIVSIIKRYNLKDCNQYVEELDRRIASIRELHFTFSGYRPEESDFKPTYRQAALYLKYLRDVNAFIPPAAKKNWSFVAKAFSLPSGKKLYESYNGQLESKEERIEGKNAKRDLEKVISMLHSFPEALAIAKSHINSFK